jgi:L-amino acid N-acyltransferase YncA
MKIEIEPMRKADWRAVAEIWREGIATGHATFTAEPVASYAALCEGKLKLGNLVARHAADGKVLGCTTLSKISSRRVYEGVAELGIYVSETARGRGVGAALMRELIARAEAAGVWTLQAGIFPENKASLALHTRHGFREVGRRERLGKMPAIGPRAGEWRDVLLLERRSAVAGV